MRVPDADSAHVTATELIIELGYGQEIVRQLGVLWGKSAKNAGGRVNLLLCHLFDTAAVAELMWHHYLAQRTKRLLDELSGGHGLMLLMWLCGVHDCGKATPAFQAYDDELAALVRAAGLGWRAGAIKSSPWRHDKAGARLLLDLLDEVWSVEQVSWVWPLIAGHHGTFPGEHVLKGRLARGEHQGRGAAWHSAQQAVVKVLTAMIGYPDLSAVQPLKVPTRADQLTLSGLIVMADWVASDQRFFKGIDTLDDISLATSRERAQGAWRELRLRGGWADISAPGGDLIRLRFDEEARSSQLRVIDVARAMPAPGLMIIEAPMGEGKTKAALAAAEVLAARFGADGVYIGMPTQATCDPMFSQVQEWVQRFQPDLFDQVVLLHGKRMFNREWKMILNGVEDDPDAIFEGIYEDDPYGCVPDAASERRGPGEWFLGRKRGLLASLVVGTIDQLLYAATRTRHVMLRFAGLTGKVVILDEVHAADIYMEQFLAEALRWLGQARIPVILLSATLPPRQRHALVSAYLAGALQEPYFTAGDLPPTERYPSVTAAYPQPENRPGYLVDGALPWRATYPVAIDVLPDASDDPEPIVEVLRRELIDGGIALVICNTVDRAQQVFRVLRKDFIGQVLLHGRICASNRAKQTEQCLKLLGRSAGPKRPRQLVVVATQVAEQSFDIDADLLITDLAPIDLLLQRIGRLHRHDNTARPPGLQAPRVIVTGFVPAPSAPRLHSGSEAIYGRYRLIRTAALVLKAVESGWSIPAQVPSLVAKVYGDEPIDQTDWGEDEAAARQSWLAKQDMRAQSAESFLLSQRGELTKATLEGLHDGEARGIKRDEDFDAVVRDGEPSVEVIVVRRRGGRYEALDGTSLGINGEGADQVLDNVIGGATRLPVKLTSAAEDRLKPLAGWTHPWLKYARALELDDDGVAILGDHRVTYDAELGLVVEKTK